MGRLVSHQTSKIVQPFGTNETNEPAAVSRTMRPCLAYLFSRSLAVPVARLSRLLRKELIKRHVARFG